MSLGISARLKHPKMKQNDLMKSQTLISQLKQEGLLETVESVMQGVDQVTTLLSAANSSVSISYRENIINLCQHLKVYGLYLDVLYQDQMNRAFVVFRNSSQDDERLDYLSRLHLLELIELRANEWKSSDLMNQYYRNKADISDSCAAFNESLLSITNNPPMLSAGEVLKSSGKFKQPTRIPGKNYCKDEVVIRNADSGKVMGIKGRRVHMIEELSETIISFQRVNPGAKERLVQITGANEESIEHAKQLIEDTIRRNASPAREHSAAGGPLTGSSSSINSSASEESGMMMMQQQARSQRSLLHSLSTNDANIGEYKYTVVTNGHTLRITGENLELVRTSKLVLDEFFSRELLQDVGKFESFERLHCIEADLPPLVLSEGLRENERTVTNGRGMREESAAPMLRRPNLSIEEIMLGTTENGRYQYSVEELARFAKSPLSVVPPADWEKINKEFPNIAKKDAEMFDVKQFLNERLIASPPSFLSVDETNAAEV